MTSWMAVVRLQRIALGRFVEQMIDGKPIVMVINGTTAELDGK
jgi:hypothetical protein